MCPKIEANWLYKAKKKKRVVDGVQSYIICSLRYLQQLAFKLFFEVHHLY